jgi:lipoate-protein ligase A
MARDVAVLHAVADGAAPPTLRLYGWAPPCLTLGRHQELTAANLDFCRAEGIDVVRRPTGGRALLHHLELTYAVIAPLGQGPLPRNLQLAYRTICGALVRALRTLGADAELTGGEVNLQLPGPRSTVPCFEVPAGGEVVVADRKLVGSAMRAHQGAILQHGAILLDWDRRLQLGALKVAHERTFERHITTLTAELGRTVRRLEVESAVAGAFQDELGVVLDSSALSAAESAREEELVGSFETL